MAKGRVSGGTGLNLTAKLKTADALKEADKFIKKLNEINKAAGISPVNSGVSKVFDVKPLTEYQAGLLKIKQEAADAARARQTQSDAEKKAKQDQAAADKAASLVMQKALAEERLARQAVMLTTAKNRLEMQEATKLAREQAAAVKKLNEEYAKNKPVKNRDFSIEAQSQNASSKANALYTSTVTSRVVADAKLTTELAKQAAVQNNLTAINNVATNATAESTAATNANAQSKKQLAQQLILEKATQQAAQSALKAYTLEQAAAKGSTEQRKLALDRLRLAYSQLNEQERNSPAGTRLATIIRGVTDQVKNLELATKGSVSGLKAQEGMFTSLKSQLLGVAAGYASLAAAAAAAKAVIHTNAEVSDSMADVQRTAKLTADQTDDLADSLKKLDRRTNLTSLLDIGYIGGQLGVGKNDIQGYIEKIDELGVVLKKEFPGGAEAVAVSLGKLNSIYKITASEGITLEQSLSKIGSALLGIAHDGPVNVQYLQDFALRTAGAAQVAKLSLPTMLAYGAVLSEAGVTAQVASSSVNRLVSSLSGKREKYLAIAQLADSSLTIEKFTKLINTDTKAALDLFFKGLKSGNPTQTEFNDRMSTLNFKVGAATNSITALALGQDKLSRKVSIGNEEYEKATLSAENFAIKNNTLAASMDKVGNAISNITTDPNSGLGKSIKFILDAVTDAIHALDNLMGRMGRYKSSYDDFFDRIQMAIINDPEASARVNERKQIKAQQAYKSLIEANRDQVVAQGKIKAKDIIDKNATEAALKSALKIEEGLLKSYFKQRDAAVAYYTNPENKDQALLTVAEKKAKDLQATLLRQKTSVDLLRNAYKGKYGAVQKQEGQDEESPLVRTIDVIKADIKRVMDLKKPLDTASKQYKDYLRQLGVLKKELKVANGRVDPSGESAAKQLKSAIAVRNNLQSQIDSLTKKGVNKQLSADEEELESVKDKYQKMRDEAIKFNNDPKNKTKGLRVDSGNLLRAEGSEQDSIRDKQAAAKLKVSLDDQKKMYDDYESYKDKVGKEAADKRYAELIDTNRTYLEKLEIQRTAITNPQKSKGGSEEDIKASEEQLKVLDKEIANEKLANQKKQDDLVASLIDYHQQRKVLIEKYNRDLEIIGNNQTSKDQRTKLFEKELKELDFANLKKLESYEALFKGIDQLSERSALKQLEFARKALDKDILSGSITDPDEIAKIKAYFNQVEQTIKEGSGKAIKELGSAFSEVGSEISKVNSELGNMLSAVGSILSKVGDIKAGFKEFELAKVKGDGLGQLSAGLGIFGAGVSIFQSVVKLFDRSAQREAQAAYSRDLQIKQTEAVNKALERQIALLSDAYGTDRIVKYAEALRQAAEDEKKYQDQLGGKFQLTGNKELDDIISKINAGEKRIYAGATEDFIKKNQAQFDKLKLPSDFNALQKLLDEGKLDATTSIIVQNLIKAGEAAKELKNQLNAENVGSSLSQIADDFIKTLTDGRQDFGKSFEDTVRTSLLNGFKGELIRKQLQAFYDQFADLTKDGGLSASDIEALKNVYAKAADKAKQDIEDLEKATGIKLTGSTDTTALKPNTLTAALNQPTGERLEGLWRGQFDLTKQLVVSSQTTGMTMGQMYEIATANLNVAIKIEANTFRTANNTDSLAGKLDQIITNTKPSKSARD